MIHVALKLYYNYLINKKKPEQANSQYIIPSWSTEGIYVASGSVDPILHVWDIRYNAIELPSKSWSMHTRRILRAEFHPSKRHTIFTLSSDRKLGIHNLTVR